MPVDGYDPWLSLDFGVKGAATTADVWRLATEALDTIHQDQQRARRDVEALGATLSTIGVWDQTGVWVDSKAHKTAKF